MICAVQHLDRINIYTDIDPMVISEFNDKLKAANKSYIYVTTITLLFKYIRLPCGTHTSVAIASAVKIRDAFVLFF